MAAPAAPLPQWMIFVEWAASDLKRYISSELFKKHAAHHDAALRHIEMYRLAFW